MLMIQHTSTLISQNNVPHCDHKCATLWPKHGTFRLDIRKKRIIDIIIYVKVSSKNKRQNKPFLVHFAQTLCVSHPPGTTFSKKVVPAEKSGTSIKPLSILQIKFWHPIFTKIRYHFFSKSGTSRNRCNLKWFLPSNIHNFIHFSN